MIYCIYCESDTRVVQSAQSNINTILSEHYNARLIPINGDAKSTKNCKLVRSALKDVRKGDIVLIQYPFWHGTAIFSELLETVKSVNNAKVAIFIHDVVNMLDGHTELLGYEVYQFKNADILIMPSKKLYERMCGYYDLTKHNIRTIYYDMFDCPFDANVEFHSSTQFRKRILYTGDMDRMEDGLKSLDKIDVNIYGCAIDEKYLTDKIHWKGSFEYNDIALELHNSGGFGLIWTNHAAFERYYLYNAPYELTTYIIAEIPLICKKGSAYGKYVEDNGIGICVNSLTDAQNIILNMQKSEYENMLRNIRVVKDMLLCGYNTRKALNEMLDIL